MRAGAGRVAGPRQRAHVHPRPRSLARTAGRRPSPRRPRPVRRRRRRLSGCRSTTRRSRTRRGARAAVLRRGGRPGCRQGPGPAGWPGCQGMPAVRSRRRDAARSTRAMVVAQPSRAAGCAGPNRPSHDRHHRHHRRRADRRRPRLNAPLPRRPPWLRPRPRQPPRRRSRPLPRRPTAHCRRCRGPIRRRPGHPQTRPRRPPLRSPRGSSRPRRSAPLVRHPVRGPPPGEPSPGRSDRPGTRSRGSTPPGERGRGEPVERLRNSGGDDRGPRRARRDRPRRPRTGRPERRPRGAVRVQSPGDDTGPISPRPCVAWSPGLVWKPSRARRAVSVDRRFPGRRA